MSLTIVRSLPEEEWRRFVEQQPAGNIFHTPEMFHVFSRTRGHQPELWAATKNGRILVLLLPVEISLTDGLVRNLTTRAVVYGSVMASYVVERFSVQRILGLTWDDVDGRYRAFLELTDSHHPRWTSP